MRAEEYGPERNPMIGGCMIKIFRDVDGNRLKERLRQYLPENKL